MQKIPQKKEKSMSNAKAMQYWQECATKDIIDPLVVKVQAHNDHSDIDIAFVKRFIQKGSTRLLDIGAGTGLMVNALYPYCKHITAVEPMAQFAKFIVQTETVHVVQENILSYELQENAYDIALLFGVMHYVNSTEAASIYTKLYRSLQKVENKGGGEKESSILIVKQQFGVAGVVCVDGFSANLNTNYYSEYRTVEEEKILLSDAGFCVVEVVDIYPQEYNRFDNTHFYAIIAQKQG